MADTDDPGDRALLVAAWVVPRRDDEVLLQLRQGTGYMDEHRAVLAGHLERGETITAAAVREAAEESGVVVDPAVRGPAPTSSRRPCASS